MEHSCTFQTPNTVTLHRSHIDSLAHTQTPTHRQKHRDSQTDTKTNTQAIPVTTLCREIFHVTSKIALKKCLLYNCKLLRKHSHIHTHTHSHSHPNKDRHSHPVTPNSQKDRQTHTEIEWHTLTLKQPNYHSEYKAVLSRHPHCVHSKCRSIIKVATSLDERFNNKTIS